MPACAANPSVNLEALKSEIRSALINQKSFACPIAMRVAWHSGGTYDKTDGSGGTNGATMRFEPEISDDANAGLHIVRDMLHLVQKKFPQVSMADLWAFAGCVAIEFMGGPMPPFKFGRTDDADGKNCPPNGRLPDASQGADHLREVFYRMGFNDQEIVALSGGHTVGRCHAVRSGYDGAWTTNPLGFDNQYFKNLLEIEWKPKEWEGEFQYTDPTDKLVMLPTDIALIEDPEFRKHVERYAADQQVFFDEFASAYGKLMVLGCPGECDPASEEAESSPKDLASAEFRDSAMHGSVGIMKRLADEADVHEVEANSGRNALHKAAFWGHIDAVRYLTDDLKLDVNAQDDMGDTALHDAARFGHTEVAQALVDAGTDLSLRNAAGHTPAELADEYGKEPIVKMLQTAG
ncbi:MAG: peroxidase family protein [Planctomycetota bacterium]